MKKYIAEFHLDLLSTFSTNTRDCIYKNKWLLIFSNVFMMNKSRICFSWSLLFLCCGFWHDLQIFYNHICVKDNSLCHYLMFRDNFWIDFLLKFTYQMYSRIRLAQTSYENHKILKSFRAQLHISLTFMIINHILVKGSK